MNGRVRRLRKEKVKLLVVNSVVLRAREQQEE